VVLVAGCGDDGVHHLADAPATIDGTDGAISAIDAAIDAPIDAAIDAPGFAPKTMCDAPVPIVDLSGNEYGFYPQLYIGPTASTLVWSHATIGASDERCEALVLGGVGHTLAAACDAPASTASGDRVVVAWHPHMGSGSRALYDGATWTELGSSTPLMMYGPIQSVALGAGGGIEAWTSPTGIGAATISPAGVDASSGASNCSPIAFEPMGWVIGTLRGAAPRAAGPASPAPGPCARRSRGGSR